MSVLRNDFVEVLREEGFEEMFNAIENMGGEFNWRYIACLTDDYEVINQSGDRDSKNRIVNDIDSYLKRVAKDAGIEVIIDLGGFSARRV